MKLLFQVIMLLAFGNVMQLNAQKITGSIVDEKNTPIAYANVVVLSVTDSTFLQGTITKDNGSFELGIADTKQVLLKVSSIEFETCYRTCTICNVGTIVMKERSQMLGEVTIKGHRPTYTLTAEGLQTNVQGTVLSKLGTAENVLSFIPGLQKKSHGYEVFGKGSPVIYIDGRLLRDDSELDQLKSENIKNVELITNPGAKYDASVRAVIKIKTKAKVGEGLGFELSSCYYQSENLDLRDQMNWNYRHRKLDLFGTLYYSKDEGRNESWLTQDVYVDTLWHQDNYQLYKKKYQTFSNKIGLNYSIDENNSIGATYTLKLKPDEHAHTIFNTNLTANGKYYDKLENDIMAVSSYQPDHLVSAYYHGAIGKTEVDFNSDYLFNKYGNKANFNEISHNKDSRVVTSSSFERNQMFASKLILGYPLFGGMFNAGAEYTRTKRNDDYINNEGVVPSDFSLLEEQNISPFIEYSLSSKLGSLSAGLRYEHVNFDYSEDGKHIDEQSRNFSNLFPSISWSSELGKMQMQFSYSAKTQRPSYEQLSNNIAYGNRFTLQSGNPLLKHEIIHDLSFMGIWKFINFSLSYNDRKNAIIYWAEQMDENPSVTRISFKNLNSLKSAMASISLSPKIGLWSPEFYMGVNKQWLNLETKRGTYKLNDPIFSSSLYNVFDLSHNWTFTVEMNYTSKGDMANCSQTKDVFYMNAGVIKTFCHDRFIIKLGCLDIFHGKKTGDLLQNNQMAALQISQYDSREVYLTLRYKFNLTRSKYKGTGAGSSEINRL